MRKNPKSRGGFTLVEVMIAATLSLVLVGLVVQIFATVGTTASETRSVVQMTDRLRAARIVLQEDMSNITAEMRPPLKVDAGMGYFEYSEGPDGPIFPGLTPANWTGATPPGPPPVAWALTTDKNGKVVELPDSTVGDPDDMLMFTAQAPAGTYFYGRARAATQVIDGLGRVWTMPIDTMAQSAQAEICYFMRGDTLYRRVLLIMPATYWPQNQIDPNIFLWSQYPNYVNASTTTIPQPVWDIAYYDKFDVSARQQYGLYDLSSSSGGAKKAPVLVPNSLGDLTRRQNRYGHQPWVYPFDSRFWDARFWNNPTTNLPGAGCFLGLPTLRECSFYTGSTTGATGVARWPFPLCDFGDSTATFSALVPPGVPVSGSPAIASQALWGKPLPYFGSGLTPAVGVQTPVAPYNTLPLIYPYPMSPSAVGTPANYQPFITIPSSWTGRINLTETQGGMFDLWGNGSFMGPNGPIVAGPFPLDQQDPLTGSIFAFSSVYEPANWVNIDFSTRYADDVLLTHVLSFDVKAWDNTAPTIQTDQTFGGMPPGLYMPGDAGYVQIINAWAASGLSTLQQYLLPAVSVTGAASGGYVVAQGAYVDLNYLGPVIAQYILASPPTMAQALARVSTFSGPGVAQFGTNFSTGSGLGMLYDTGCFDYENDGIDQNQNGIIDEYTNGLDDNGIGGVDDITEVEGPVPYPVPLKGIQIKIRVYEPDSRQIREVTVTEDFLWE
jgi:type II secretory pathway pseudopilin PulG